MGNILNDSTTWGAEANKINENLKMLHGVKFEVGGYILSSNGNKTPSASRTTTDFLDVSGSEKIMVRGFSNGSTISIVAFYNAEQVYISSIIEGTGEHLIIEKANFPLGTKYIRCTGAGDGSEYCFYYNLELANKIRKLIDYSSDGNIAIDSIINEDWERWDDPAYSWGLSPTSVKIPTIFNSQVEAEGMFVSRGGMGYNRSWRQHVFQGWNKENTYRFTIPVGVNNEDECALQIYKPDELKFGKVRVGTDAANFGLLCEHEKTTVERNLFALRLPVYNDNTSATSAGLEVGQIYRTSTGELRIVI